MCDIDADDVTGHWIFNEEKGMGLGKAVERKTARNLRGDTKDVFVCVMPSDGKRVNREVDSVLQDVNEYGYELYDEHPWGAEL